MWPGASSSNMVNAAAGLIIAALVIAALILARDFIIPLALAGFFSFALQPAVRWLEDHKLPRPAAVVLVVFSLLAVLGVAAAAMGREASNFAAELPKYETNLRSKIRSASGMLEGAGLWRRATEVLRHVEGEMKETPKGGEPLKVEVQNEPTAPFAVLLKYLQLSISLLTSAGLGLLFTVFILLQYHDLRDRIVRVMGPAEIGRSTQVLNDAALGLAHFFRLQAGLNVSFGIVIGVSLWAIGLPNAFMWGAFAAILRFVPYIGGALAALFPIALAAAVEPGWTKLLLTAALFGVAEFVAAQVIEPLLFGTRTRLSPLAVLLSAAFWTTIWGPVGLLLSMPITLAILVFADHVPLLSFFGVLLGNTPALNPEQRLYHLLLAGDASSAVEEMEEWLKEDHKLIEYLDQVAIPALAIAANDSTRGVLRIDQSERLKKAVEELVEFASDVVELEFEKQNRDHAGKMGTRALVLPARGTFDLAASRLFALAAERDGRVTVTCAPAGGLMGINAAAGDRATRNVDYTAILSLGEATSSQLRLLMRRLSRAIPVPLGLLVIGEPRDPVRALSDPAAQVNLTSSSKMLLDKIKATPTSSSAITGPETELIPSVEAALS